MKPFPFKLPVRVEDDCYLVADDSELIVLMEAATPEEISAIVRAINGFEEAEKLIEWIARNPGCHPANINKEAMRFLEKFS